MGKGCLAVLLLPLIAVVVAFGLILMVTLGSPGNAVANGVCGTAGTPGTVPTGTKKVGDFSGKQLQNAADIMSAASDLDLPVAAQILGVQTAIGESTLTVVDHGDAAGPDSRGLFQQRANGSWGSYGDRMDPHTSATNFFKAMQQVEGWQELRPTIAINRTQRNADENYYTQYRTQAVAVVKALSKGEDDQDDADSIAAIDDHGSCTAGDSETIGDLGSGDWVNPLPDSRQTSGFGGRLCPAGTSCNANTADHKGVDFSTGGGVDVLAPTDMKITVAEKGQGWKADLGTYIIAVQVEKPGLVFEFHHLVHGSLKVKAGDTVAAGTPLGTEGNTGNSSGAHLHFQVAKPGTPANEPTFKQVIDPVPILKSKGVL